MATTTTPSDRIEIQYRRQVWLDGVRTSGFKPYMGTGDKGLTSIIHTAMENTKGGKTLTIPLVSSLRNGGVRGNARLGGREEKIGKHTFTLGVQIARHGVELSEQDEHYDFAKSVDLSRSLLTRWERELVRDRIIDGLGQVAYSTTGAPQAATFFSPRNAEENVLSDATQNNAWNAANVDRVLYGKLKSNYNATFATALANVDSTDDKLTTNVVSLLKEIARDTVTNARINGKPTVSPVIDEYGESGREYYVLFAGQRAFRDLKTDTAMQTANREARAREGNGMDNNPLFQDGDLIWDGVIIREIPEIPVLTGVGASSIDVAPVFLCGTQALCMGWGSMPDFRKKGEDDYGQFSGIAITEMSGASKVVRKDGESGALIDNAIVTGFVSGVASA